MVKELFWQIQNTCFYCYNQLKMRDKKWGDIPEEFKVYYESGTLEEKVLYRIRNKPFCVYSLNYQDSCDECLMRTSSFKNAVEYFVDQQSDTKGDHFYLGSQVEDIVHQSSHILDLLSGLNMSRVWGVIYLDCKKQWYSIEYNPIG